MPTPLTWNAPGLLWNGPGLVWNGVAATPQTKLMSKIVLNLDNLTDTETAQLARNLADGLTINVADFPNPEVTPAQLTAAATASEAAVTTMTTRQQAALAATQAKEVALASLRSLLGDCASWAERKIKDPLKLMKVFTLKKPPTPISSLGQVQALAIRFGDHTGSLDLVWEPTTGARSYELQCRYAAGAWIHAKTCTGSKISLADLQNAQMIQIRVRAIGPKGMEGPWSDLAEHLVP